MTTTWTRAHLVAVARDQSADTPVFGPADYEAIIDGLWLWDFWPTERPDGSRALVGGSELWFALSSPVFDDPDDRHAVARIRMLRRDGQSWSDLGPAFPEGFTPGSREWSGSAIFEDDRLSLYFTAAGRRGEIETTFEQRIFVTTTTFDTVTGRFGEWQVAQECFASDGAIYAHTHGTTGEVGTINAFRDPAWFRDAATGDEYILFTASVAASRSAFSGCIGIARRTDRSWELLEALVTADGVNNELERPHVRLRNERYVLFWSTQSQVFARGLPHAPSGLYAMVADNLLGPYRPIQPNGLLVANPRSSPMQAYSWWVTADGEVSSFVDRAGPDLSFVGTIAPTIGISLDQLTS